MYSFELWPKFNHNNHFLCFTCDPNGTKNCEDVGDGIHYNCICNDKYSGIYCTTFQDACQSIPCRNGAQCIIQSNSGGMDFSCMCATGWTGLICDVPINECASNPCFYEEFGSRCIDGVGEFFCHCAPGFSGLTCGQNINECQSKSEFLKNKIIFMNFF